MTKPKTFISKSGQLWRSGEGDYQLVNEDLSFVLGSCINNKAALTTCGQIYLVKSEELIGIDGKKIIQFAANFYGKRERQFLALTDTGKLYHIMDSNEQREVRLLQTKVTRFIDSYCNQNVTIQFTDGRWSSLDYMKGKYYYQDLPLGNEYEAQIGDNPSVMGRIITSNGSLSYLTSDGEGTSYAEQILLPQGMKFKKACEIEINEDDQEYECWYCLIAIDENNHLYSIHERGGGQVAEVNLISDKEWSDLVLLDYRCCAVDESGQLYLTYEECYILIEPVEIPPHVLNGSDRFSKTKNANTSQ